MNTAEQIQFDRVRLAHLALNPDNARRFEENLPPLAAARGYQAFLDKLGNHPDAASAQLVRAGEKDGILSDTLKPLAGTNG